MTLDEAKHILMLAQWPDGHAATQAEELEAGKLEQAERDKTQPPDKTATVDKAKALQFTEPNGYNIKLADAEEFNTYILTHWGIQCVQMFVKQYSNGVEMPREEWLVYNVVGVGGQPMGNADTQNVEIKRGAENGPLLDVPLAFVGVYVPLGGQGHQEHLVEQFRREAEKVKQTNSDAAVWRLLSSYFPRLDLPNHFNILAQTKRG